MGAWVAGLRWFGWVVVLLMLLSMGYASVRVLLLYSQISV